MTAAMSTDTSWYLDINHFSRDTSWLHSFLAAYALWGGLVVLAAALVGAWWFSARRGPDAPRRVAIAWLGGAGAVVALAANQGIGSVVDRTRPCHTFHHALVLLSCANDASFPSDHAMIGGALVAGVFLVSRRLGLAAMVAALLLAFSRVYAGVHYPGDVGAGLLIGAAIDALLVLLLRPLVAAGTRRLVRTPLQALVTVSARRLSGPISR